MAEVEEVVGHLGRPRVPVRRRQVAGDEAGVVVLGDLRQRRDRVLGRQPHQVQRLGHARGRGGARPGRYGQVRIDRGYLHAGPVGREPEAVVGASQGVALDGPRAERRVAVRAGVPQGGQLASQPHQAPALAQQVHRHRLVVADVRAASHRMPAPSQRRMLVVDPGRAPGCVGGSVHRCVPLLAPGLVDGPERGRDLRQPLHGSRFGHCVVVNLGEHIHVAVVEGLALGQVLV